MTRKIKAVNDEPEYPGEMPSEMWVAMQDRDVATEVMRQSVRFTKQGILERGQTLQEG